VNRDGAFEANVPSSSSLGLSTRHLTKEIKCREHK